MKIPYSDHPVIIKSELGRCQHFYLGILGKEPDPSNGRCAAKAAHQEINIHCKKQEFLSAATSLPTADSGLLPHYGG